MSNRFNVATARVGDERYLNRNHHAGIKRKTTVRANEIHPAKDETAKLDNRTMRLSRW